MFGNHPNTSHNSAYQFALILKNRFGHDFDQVRSLEQALDWTFSFQQTAPFMQWLLTAFGKSDEIFRYNSDLNCYEIVQLDKIPGMDVESSSTTYVEF